jgi:hypothetical protein
LKNKYFVKRKSPENIEFLRNKYFVVGKSLKMSEFLKNKYFFNEISSSYIFIPEKNVLLEGKCPSFV